MPAAAVPDYIHESVRTLPVLPTAVTRLLSLARDINVDFREIARVIETDQTLTARTLRAANSPLNGVSRPVKTVRQAAVLLGADTIINLALGVSVISLQSGLYKNLPVDPNAFERHSIAVGHHAHAFPTLMSFARWIRAKRSSGAQSRSACFTRSRPRVFLPAGVERESYCGG